MTMHPGSGLSGTTGRNVTSVTYNGTNATRGVHAGNGGTSWASSEVWRLDNPTADGNAHDVVVVWEGNQSQMCGSAIGFIGAQPGDFASNSATGSSANPSVTVAATESGDEQVAVLFSDTGPAAATTQNGTLIAEDEDVAADSDYNAQRQTATGANTVSAWTCSDTTNPWAVCAYVVRPAAVTVGSGLRSRHYPSKPMSNLGQWG